MLALLGVNSVDQLGPEYLQFTDSALRPAHARPSLKLMDGAKAAEL